MKEKKEKDKKLILADLKIITGEKERTIKRRQGLGRTLQVRSHKALFGLRRHIP